MAAEHPFHQRTNLPWQRNSFGC